MRAEQIILNHLWDLVPRKGSWEEHGKSLQMCKSCQRKAGNNVSMSEQGWFTVRKNSQTVRVMKAWNKFLGAVMESQSPETYEWLRWACITISIGVVVPALGKGIDFWLSLSAFGFTDELRSTNRNFSLAMVPPSLDHESPNAPSPPCDLLYHVL